MFGGILQPMHLVIILAIVLIIFGPGKLPELGKTLGSGIREFRDSVGQGGTAAATQVVVPPVVTSEVGTTQVLPGTTVAPSAVTVPVGSTNGQSDQRGQV